MAGFVVGIVYVLGSIFVFRLGGDEMDGCARGIGYWFVYTLMFALGAWAVSHAHFTW